jgi:hypothetical protein
MECIAPTHGILARPTRIGSSSEFSKNPYGGRSKRPTPPTVPIALYIIAVRRQGVAPHHKEVRPGRVCLNAQAGFVIPRVAFLHTGVLHAGRSFKRRDAAAKTLGSGTTAALFDRNPAQAHCPKDEAVWLNTASGIWHEKGMR